MSIHLLLEAAARSLVMGAIIWVALHIMRIWQVRARRTAWLLALVGALAMPLLVGAQFGPRLLPDMTFAKAPYALESAPWMRREPYVAMPAQISAAGGVSQRAEVPEREGEGVSLLNALTSVVVIAYGVIAGVLLLRLCFGIGFAFRLRNGARRVALDPVGLGGVIAQFDPALDVRSSARIGAPVTIGSTVLLPLGYAAWGKATLRIVLSHERAHVLQGDFYIHALAELHCALFWFNPFGWWLRRELSELGEALSDRAAVEQAASRAAYAEILLAFAARGGRPLAGVAMASASNLTSRIERLLSEKNFERSFAGKQRLPLAAGAVIFAMFAATATWKVHAVPPTAPAALTAPPAPVAVDAPTAPAALPAPPAPVAVDAPTAPKKPVAPKKTHALKTPAAPQRPDTPKTPDSTGESIEGVVGLHVGDSRISVDSGKDLPRLSGDYIYFQHNGKPYLIQDPSILTEAQKMLEPMQELAEQQRKLGIEQAMLGAEQRQSVQHLANINSADFKVDTAEFKREMTKLQSQIKQMDLGELNAKIDQQTLAEVQSHLAEIQADTARLQAQVGDHLRGVGAQQGGLGERQSKLGEQQRALAEQQRKIVENLRRQLQPIIEHAIRDGKGTLLTE